jgi:hypothetical protein
MAAHGVPYSFGIMTRLLLGGIALSLRLLALGRLERSGPVRPDQAMGSRTREQRSPAVVASPTRSAPTPAAPTGTPTVDLLARLESRRQLTAAGSTSYFDSLWVETDSVLRRWADPSTTLLVAIHSDAGRPDPELTALVQRALAVWEAAALPIRFTLTSDSSGAHLIVRSTTRLPGALAGQTDLGWTPDGAIRSALITLARNDSTGHPIPYPVALAIAVHEFGHALGLPHSSDPADVMYQAARATQLSSRDLATVRLLYSLPLGSIREPNRP